VIVLRHVSFEEVGQRRPVDPSEQPRQSAAMKIVDVLEQCDHGF
jgi:hypothetical protein